MAAATSVQNGPTSIGHGPNGINEEGDPFTVETSPTNTTPHRFSSFDTQLFALNHPSSSPAQAKKALEAHLAETDRRIQETSKLGTSLVQQRGNLAQRIRDVDLQVDGSKIGPELRQKLIDIEREYNEVGRQSAKAFLGPKYDASGPDAALSTPFALDGRNPTSPTKLSSQAVDSPSKVNVPRKQRNQASNNQEIEFAAEITTSLLGQVRHLQAVLAERDETLKSVSAEKSKLEVDVEGFMQRIKRQDDNEQRYKDENWNLETQLQEIQASAREAANREHKLHQAFASSTSEKNAAQQELDEIKLKHGKVTDEFALTRKFHESELAGLRKECHMNENEKTSLQRKIEELTSQNQELARGLHNRLRAEEAKASDDGAATRDDDSFMISEPEPSPPPSPTKGGQRHSMLESETLKSSLNHAHKMIQNLKGNVNREKSEKFELKRMLQEARDELEARRAEPSEKRHRSKAQQDAKLRAVGLGAARNGRTDITSEDPENDPEWEDTGDATSSHVSAQNGKRLPSAYILARADSSDAYQTANETEDAFETANERDTTDNDAFQTGAESMADESSGDLTETEDLGRGGTVRGANPLMSNKPRDRTSVQSTASTSEDEDGQTVQTPIQGQTQRFRMRMSRDARRSRGLSAAIDSTPSTAKNSPASFTQGGAEGGQSLAAELENLSGEEDGTPSKASVGTPGSAQFSRRVQGKRSSSSLRKSIESQPSTPGLRVGSAIYTGAPPVPRLPMVDSGMMTEPWEPPQNAIDTAGSSSGISNILPGAATAAITSRIFGSTPSTPQKQDLISEPVSDTKLDPSITTTASTPSQPVWDHSLEQDKTTGTDASTHSTPLSTRSATSETRRLDEGLTGTDHLHDLSSRTTRGNFNDFGQSDPKPALSLSAINTLDSAPVDPISSPSRYLPTSSDAATSASTSHTREGSSGGILGSVFGWRKAPASSGPQIAEDENSREIDSTATPTDDTAKMPLQDASANTINRLPPAKGTESTDKKAMSAYKADQGSQTILSSEQIENMLQAKTTKPSFDADKSMVAPSMKPLTDIGALMAATPAHQGKLPEVRVPEGSNRDPAVKGIKRPSSATSIRSRSAQYPPLPPDHQEAIAAAAQKDPSSSSMGPPLMPASAYQSRSIRPRTSSRPQTPSQQGYPTPSSKGGTTPRAGRFSTHRSMTSRRSSVSSFASELDQRFNIRADGFIAPGAQGNTDPRMIQAITQTMIGERMWKYTRKAGRGEMSNTRHPRFFWVHPYTRTLYWSDRDPATANRAELKSKSVAIEAVRVVIDDNPMPPGLHRKSLIVITPGRSVKFTAQTSQRHETWFNALSYLLLRTGPEGEDANNENEELTDADVQEFNPMTGYDRRSSRSRVSLASFKSQAAANRNAQSSLTSRAPANSLASRSAQHPQTVPEAGEEVRGLSIRKRVSRSLSRNRNQPNDKTVGERASSSNLNASGNEPQSETTRRNSNQHKPSYASFSSRISNYWRPNEASAGNRSSMRSRSSMQGDVTEPGVLEGGRSVVSVNAANDSAEDLRRVIQEREGKGDLENVRSCCDGQHDVAALRNASGRNHNHASSTQSGRISSSANPA